VLKFGAVSNVVDAAKWLAERLGMAWRSERVDEQHYSEPPQLEQIPDSAYESIPVSQTPKAVQKAAQINWKAIVGPPPRRKWIIENWLGVGHPTLFVGPGGIGKTLLAQQILSCLAIGRGTLDTVENPVKCLMWGCEDDHNEFVRRQFSISHWLETPIADFDNLMIFPRIGLDNVLLSTEFGRPAWTMLIGELEEQVADLDADVVVLDNIAQMFGANENARHDVTMFLNGITGACCKRKPTAIILLGHPSRAQGSEFSGNSAWENAVRMRWWLNNKMPDDTQEDVPEISDTTRYLAKRKTNYSLKDYRTFEFSNGVLLPKDTHYEEGDGLRDMQAARVVVHGIDKLAERGIYGSESPGRNYLPSLLVAYELSDGVPKQSMVRAMRKLILDGKIKRAEVGKNASRMPKYGLVLC
jgi:hypothetical protein